MPEYCYIDRSDRSWNILCQIQRDLYKVLTDINSELAFVNETPVDVNLACDILHSKLNENWISNVNSIPKLRTYRVFKNGYETKPYISCMMSKSCRSFITQLRSGMLPLKIETVRYQKIPEEFRLCIFYNENTC